MNYPPILKNEQGFTLFFSLILLLILTMMGLVSIQGSVTEIAMAGNQRESDTAFQSTELGLAEGEKFIDNAASKTDFAFPASGLYSLTDEDPDYFEKATWIASKESTQSAKNVFVAPRFIIKYLIDRSQNEVAAINVGGYGTAQPGITVSNFRVTSLGVGQTDGAPRLLQSYYGKEF